MPASIATYRAYNPAIGRWLNRDPIKEAGGINLYGYVMGNPVGYVDPNGLFTASLDFIANAGAGYGGSTSINIVVGYRSECGWTYGVQRTISGGATSAVDVSLGVGVTITNAKSVNEMLGVGYAIGGSGGELIYGGGDFVGSPTIQGIHGEFGVGIYGTFGEGHAQATYTSKIEAIERLLSL